MFARGAGVEANRMNHPLQIERQHPLRELFDELVWRHFFGDAKVREREVVCYVSDLLMNFTHVDNLYRIRDACGRRIEQVGEMLVESNPLLTARSFNREREVRKHIGDYTLFMIGVFPESLRARRRRSLSLDAFVDYLRAGKESYAIVGSFDQFEYRGEAPLFRHLSEIFEECVFGLNLVRQDLERFQRAYYHRLKTALAPGPGTSP